MCNIKVVLVLLVYLTSVCGKAKFKLVLERSIIKYKDPIYIGETNTSVSKLNRTSPYVLNLYADLVKGWDYNVSIGLKTYELRNNQYRESIIRAEIDLCFAITHDQWLTPAIRKYSNLPKKCPIKPGPFIVQNFLLPEESFPSNFPAGNWRFDMKYFVTDKMKYILKMQLFFKVETIVTRKAPQKKKKA